MTTITAPPRYKRRDNYERPPRASPAPSVPRSRSRSATPDTRPRCYHCHQPTLSHEDGNVICLSCGVINESDGNFRAEIEFDETANGGAKTRGTHIGAGQSHARNYQNKVSNTGVGQEAADASERAKGVAMTQFNTFCTNLRINDREKNRALAYFNMAYKKNFYRGRTLESVAVVCLYLAIRHRACKEKYPLMLIDFAEVSGGAYNVWELGKMFKALQKLLYLDSHHDRWNELEKRKEGLSASERQRLTQEQYELFGREETALSLHDPEDLIERFCERLDFGDMTMTVQRDAVQVAKSMNRDWMTTGRRPAGIAGAAIIIAARMSNFRRTLREVVLVAKVTEITLSKRIEEFKETKSSGLSVQDFRAENVEHRPDELVTMPPSLYRSQPEWQDKQAAKNKRKRKRKKAGLQETAAEIENGEDAPIETGGETEDDETDAENDNEGETQAKRPRVDADGFAVPAIPVRATTASQPVIAAESAGTPPPGNLQRSKDNGRRPRGPNWTPPPPTEAELAEEEELTEDIRDQLRRNASLDPTGTIAQSDLPAELPPAGSGVLDIYPQPSQKDGQGPAVDTSIGNTDNVSLKPSIGSEEFEDDPDVANCVLTESERVIKETIWVTENADWLRTEHAKKIKRELKEREMREKGIDPEKERLKNRRRKDGTLRNGLSGDIRYLEEARKKQGGQGDNADGDNDAGDEDDEQRRRSISRRAQESAQTMIKQRGTFSRRVDYQKLSQAYVLPGFEESSESRSESPDTQHFLRPATGRGTQASAKRRARQGISRITGEFTTIDTDGETDADNNSPPARSRSRSVAQAEHDRQHRSPSAGSTTNQSRPLAKSPASSARQLPTPAPTQSQGQSLTPAAHRLRQAPRASPIVIEDDNGPDEGSESPLSSTHTPAGYGSGAPGTPLATAPRTQQAKVVEVVSDGEEDEDEIADDPDAFLHAGDYDEDEDDEEEDEEEEQEPEMEGAEMLMGEAEEIVEE